MREGMPVVAAGGTAALAPNTRLSQALSFSFADPGASTGATRVFGVDIGIGVGTRVRRCVGDGVGLGVDLGLGARDGARDGALGGAYQPAADDGGDDLGVLRRGERRARDDAP